MSCDFIPSAEVLRITKVNECGVPIVGTNSLVIDCFSSIAMNPEIDTVDDQIFRKPNGGLCVVKPGCSTLLYYNVEVNVNTYSPEAVNILTGNPDVLGFDGDTIGNDDCAAIPCKAGFALEFWSELVDPTCTTAATQRHLYTLIPWISGGYVNDLEIGSEAVSFQFVGKSRAGTGWGTGPFNVQAADLANTPGRMLTPLGGTCHRRMMITTIQPPTASCDLIATPALAP